MAGLGGHQHLSDIGVKAFLTTLSERLGDCRLRATAERLGSGVVGKVSREVAPDPGGRLFGPMLGVFLGGGLLASSEALLVPRLQLRLGLDYGRATVVQLVYYAGYLLFALPATTLLVRTGAMRAVAGALATMAVGCTALAVAQAGLRFGAMLAALLLLSSGVTMLQIACNGVMATAGGDRAAARFTLLQGFNALGTVAGPLVAAWLLLGADGDHAAVGLFLAFAAGFALLALLFAARRDALPPEDAARPTPARLAVLLRQPWVAQGIAAIFAYVGAEVTIGTLAVAYLMQPDRGGLAPVAAGRLVSLYWLGAMAGRFIGAGLLRRMAAPRLLGWASAGAATLVLAAMLLTGAAGCAALLAVGLANSIMFPTIYGLAMPAVPEEMPAASMLLCMAVVGGAIVPTLTGLVADRLSLPAALALPGSCYLVVGLFARGAARRPVRAS